MLFYTGVSCFDEPKGKEKIAGYNKLAALQYRANAKVKRLL